MQLFRNAVLVTNRQPIAFKCRACGVCCKNVRDSIVLEPLDAYRIVRDKQKNGCTDSADDILWNMAGSVQSGKDLRLSDPAVVWLQSLYYPSGYTEASH